MSDSILAIDRGKYKSVACLYRAGAEPQPESVPGGPIQEQVESLAERRLCEGTGTFFCSTRQAEGGGRQKTPRKRKKESLTLPWLHSR
jgi:hypothetical protein